MTKKQLEEKNLELIRQVNKLVYIKNELVAVLQKMLESYNADSFDPKFDSYATRAQSVLTVLERVKS